MLHAVGYVPYVREEYALQGWLGTICLGGVCFMGFVGYFTTARKILHRNG